MFKAARILSSRAMQLNGTRNNGENVEDRG